jgi:hypothetical protein
MACASSGVATPMSRSGDDAQEYPQGQPALEETLIPMPAHRRGPRRDWVAFRGSASQHWIAGVAAAAVVGQEADQRRRFCPSRHDSGRNVLPVAVLTRPAWASVLRVEGKCRRGQVKLLGDHPDGQAGRGVLDQQSEDGEAAVLRQRGERGDGIGIVHFSNNTEILPLPQSVCRRRWFSRASGLARSIGQSRLALATRCAEGLQISRILAI